MRCNCLFVGLRLRAEGTCVLRFFSVESRTLLRFWAGVYIGSVGCLAGGDLMEAW